MRATVEEIAQAVHGSVTFREAERDSGDRLVCHAPQECDSVPAPSIVVTGLTWDSRAVSPGNLYVALPGERVDGHDFAAAAVSAGAAAVLASKPVDVDAPVILVEDTAAAVADLAAYWRGRMKGTVIGLTGSTGKTTTKGLVRDVLSAAGSVVATKANQNNELGVPATLLAADEDTDFVVVEMGMRGLGQIEALCEIAQPEWGLVTNVGESHIELLGSRENIAKAKGELFAALPQGGIAFANGADEFTGVLCPPDLCDRGVQVVLFEGRDMGTGPSVTFREAERDSGPVPSVTPSCPTVYASGVVLDADGRPTFTMHATQFGDLGQPEADGACECLLELRGMHNVSNACSAAAVGLAAGLTLEQCCAALAQAQPEPGRQRILRTDTGITVVDDAYNANPDSMRASLSTFAALDAPGRHIAVLGDMGELGAFAQECHERVGGMAAAAGIDYLLCVGVLSEHIALAATEAGMPYHAVRHVETVDAALVELRALVQPGDAVLVKASHFMEFDRIVEGLVS